MEQEGCSALCFLPALHHGPLKVLWKSGLLKSVPFSQTAALGSGFVKDNARAHFLSLVSLGTIIKNRMILKSGGKPPEWQTSDCAWSLGPRQVREHALGEVWEAAGAPLADGSFRGTWGLPAGGTGPEAALPQGCQGPAWGNSSVAKRGQFRFCETKEHSREVPGTLIVP